MQFKLPRGYSFTEPNMQPSATVPDKGYGGADISQAYDANGVHYVGCNAWGPGEPAFRWRVFKRVGARYVEVPLPFLATGRGEMAVLPHDGALHGIAWTNETFQFDTVPGFAVFPPISELSRRIASLEARLAALPPTVTGSVVVVPPQSDMEGGEIVLQGGNGRAAWHIDEYGGKLRLHINGKVAQEWSEPPG